MCAPGYLAVLSFSVLPPALSAKARDFGDHGLELFVAGDEVRFRIDFNDGAGRAFDRKADEAFGGHAGRFLGGLGKALGAQPVDGGIHVAVDGSERCLAVHHAGAGRFAQAFHHCSCNLSHDYPRSFEKGVTGLPHGRPANQMCRD